MKRVRHEIGPLAMVLALPVAMATLFPYSALDFRPVNRPSKETSLAFVELSEQAEREALLRARSLWNLQDAKGRTIGVRPQMTELVDKTPVLPNLVLKRPQLAQMQPVTYGRRPWSPTQAAPLPAPLAPDREEPAKPAFSKDELLKLN